MAVEEDRIGRLERLNRLRESGALSQTEFETEKKRILANGAAGKHRYDLGSPAREHRSRRMAIGISATIAVFILLVAVASLRGFAGLSTQNDVIARQSPRVGVSAPPKPAAPTGVAPREAELDRGVVATGAEVAPEKEAARPQVPVRATREEERAEKLERVTAATRPAPFNRRERRLFERWHEANTVCRGGADTEAMLIACDERELAYQRMRAAGLCYGREGEYGYQMEVHRCGPRSCDVGSNCQ